MEPKLLKSKKNHFIAEKLLTQLSLDTPWLPELTSIFRCDISDKHINLIF